MLAKCIFRPVFAMLSEGRVYKIVPRKGTETSCFFIFYDNAIFVYKIVPRKGTETI